MICMKLKFVVDQKQDLDFLQNEEEREKASEQYDSFLSFIERTRKQYQESWSDIEKEFSQYIEEETGHPFYYDEYVCLLSCFQKGMSNWGNAPFIVRSWKENPFTMRRITAHELILSHYFEIYRRNYSDRGLSDGQVWALAEIAAFALTSLRDQPKKWWPWDTTYYTGHNYPHIVELQDQLKDTFDEKDFTSYMEKGFELVAKMPRIGPRGADPS